jgi:lipoate-protein ligase B
MLSAQNKNVSTIIEPKEKTDLRICDCGLAKYGKILKLQKQLWEKRYNDEIPNTVLIVEHQPVITLGARKEANKLLVSSEELKNKGIDVTETRRGGGVTAHNPGQLVFYPILKLQQLGLGITEYIRTLEAIGIELLSTFKVRCERQSGFPGLWVGEKKIASIGVRVSRFVTYHGMAININNDLSIFNLFVPCGIEGVKITSVSEQTGEKLSMNDVKNRLIELLNKYFSVKSESYENRSQITSMA